MLHTPTRLSRVHVVIHVTPCYATCRTRPVPWLVARGQVRRPERRAESAMLHYRGFGHGRARRRQHRRRSQSSTKPLLQSLASGQGPQTIRITRATTSMARQARRAVSRVRRPRRCCSFSPRQRRRPAITVLCTLVHTCASIFRRVYADSCTCQCVHTC